MRNFRLSALLFAAALLAVAPARAANTAPDLPDTAYTCNYPQAAAGAQPVPAGNPNANSPAVAWNGQEFGVLSVEFNSAYTTRTIYFTRHFADGTQTGSRVTIAVTGFINETPGLVWNGTNYVAAWSAVDAVSGYFQIYVQLLQPNGTPLGAPVKASAVGQTVTGGAYLPVLAWSGTTLLAAWSDYRVPANSSDLFFTLMNPDLTVAGGGSLHDLSVAGNTTNAEGYQTAAWLPSQRKFAIAMSSIAGAYNIIKVALYGEDGGGNTNYTWSPPGNSTDPRIADNGFNFLVTFMNSGGVQTEVYVAGPGLNPTALTSGGTIAYYPRLIWLGGEYALLYWKNGATQYQRLSASGAAIGAQTALPFNAFYFNAAFAQRGFLLASVTGSSSAVVPVGCATDSTPPTCPGNFLAYNITGTTASVSWSPSGDSESDLAYYAVYRNNTLIGKTSGTFYNDSGLPLSSTNNYMIQPVNASQLQNFSCANSIYVRTNSTLTLTMNKATTSDAGLNWTNAGFNNYNLFRGNRPQVMSQIGATPNLSSTDPNALTSPISYFYSVDNPGP